MSHVLTDLPELQKRADELKNELSATVPDNNQAVWLYIAHLEARDRWFSERMKQRLKVVKNDLYDLRNLRARVREIERTVEIETKTNSHVFAITVFIAFIALAIGAMALTLELTDFDISTITHSKPRTTVESPASEVETVEPSTEPSAAEPEEQPYKVEVLDQTTEV